MTQESRTTETINRDNAAIRDIMHRIRELTVPDRATLAVGLIGHLATLMNRSQMTRLMGELQEEAERVQDVPPSRQREQPAESADDTSPRRASGAGAGAARPVDGERNGGAAEASDGAAAAPGRSHDGGLRASGVGQAGRGEFRSGELL